MEIVISVVAKVAECMVRPILRHIMCPIVRPIARPFINLWEYKSNLGNLKNEVEKLEAKRVIVQGLTNDGVEPLPDVKVWLDKATNIINEVLELINQDNPERGCCEGCTSSNLKECYQHRNNVARKLKVVDQHLKDAEGSISLWKLKNKVEKLKDKRDSVQCSIKAGQEPLSKVQRWQDKVNSIIAEVSRLTHEDNVDCKLTEVEQLLQQEAQFSRVSTISEETRHKINLENLNKDVATLKLKIENVQCLIKVGEEPLPSVKDWQDKVKKIIDEVSGLPSEHNPEQVNRMLKDVAQLLQEEPQLPKVSYQPIPEQTCLQPGIQQGSSETRTSILKDIIAALRNADVNMVGIYGMGGVGKTTLAKKVGDQAIQDKLFDKIVFVEVSQSPDIRTIQGVIADDLHLKFEEESIPGRARKLYNVLKKEEKEEEKEEEKKEENKREKKILIILDNLWEGIKLEEVGIPFGNDCKGLKLLLTARSHDVLTIGMNLQHIFHVEALSEADAWSLFESIAGTHVNHPYFESVAHDVAKKCGGMPVAIVTIAKALKDKSQDEWNDALRKLNNPSSESFEGITKEVYNSIKLSYDCLIEQHRQIFLLCSRMGRTYDASIQDLFRYGLGLGYFDHFDTAEDALCNVCASVNQLKAASLLLHAPETDAFYSYDIPTPAWERFAIHDVICDVARSIASKDQHVFTVINSHVPRFLTNENTLKSCTSITLYNIDELSKDLELSCPNIKFFYVKPKHSDLTIPDNFFIGMSSLQVLHLIEGDLKPLPSSLSCLANLQALCLDHCKLGDVVAIGDMNELEVLSFRGSDITMLPKELCQLTKLRLLDLMDCSKLSVIPSKVMSSLTGIEALYMNNTSIKWEDARPSIDELKHLRRLTTLEIHIPESKMFRCLISLEPKRYNISIGGVTYHWRVRKPYSNISRRFLRVKLDTKEDWIISQLPGVEELELEGDVVGAMNLLDDLGRNGFPRLLYLHVSANNHCVCIVSAVLPSLESLMVEDMESLEKICDSPLGADSFLNLKTIHVENCNKLSNIFCFFSIVRVLPNLIDLKVFDCENMEEIFAIEEQDDGDSTEVVHDIKFSQLSCLRLTKLPQLKSFCCKAKTASPLQLASDTSASQIFSAKELNNYSSLFNEKIATPNLQDLEVRETHQIEKIWHGLLPTLSSCVQNLTNLSVYRCNNLKELFSSSMTISEESGENERKDTIVFPKLCCLKMEDLTKLTRLCSGYNVEFPSLKIFEIQSCPQFKKFIFDETVRVPSLEEMRIFDMDNLKMIWHNKLTEDSFSKLKSLKVTMSKKLLTVFPSNMCGRLLSLESLNVEDCSSLVQICDLQGINSEEYDHVSFMSLQESEVLRCPSLRYISAKEGVVVKEVPAKFVFPKLTSLTLNPLQPPLVITVLLKVFLHCEACAAIFRKRIKRMKGVESVETDLGKNQVVVKGEVDPWKLLDYIYKRTTKRASIVKCEKRKEEEKKEVETKKDEKVERGTKTEGEEGPILKELVLCECGIHHTDEEGQMRQPLYLVQQLVFPCLENFKLTGKELMMMGQAQVPGCFFPKLKILDVREHESTDLPLGIIQRFQNLENLLLTGKVPSKRDSWSRPISLKERFFCGEDQTQAAPLAKIKTLVLQCLGDLKYMWEQDSKWDLIFQNLEVLEVYGCNSLVNLMPPSASFQNLTILDVVGCDSLETIVAFSTAKSLVKLEKMCIYCCPKMTEVIQNQGDVTERIIFSNLKTLELGAADRLTSFCSCNFTLAFPSLQELKVRKCWNMETFSRGDLTMPRLQEVMINGKSFKLCPDTNLNTIIQQFYEENSPETGLRELFV